MTSNRKRTKLYEGKAKILFEGPEPGTIVQYFKDDATAFNNEKHEVISGKGVLNNRISEYIMKGLTNVGVPNHFIKTLNMREQLVKEVEIIPLEVIVRNVAAGSFSRNFGIKEGESLSQPLIEFCYKSDEHNDPLVSDEHIVALNWAAPIELEEMKHLALRVNDFLGGLFYAVGIKLVDFKIEFGRHQINDEGYIEILLADEISPDSCRLWDIKTGNKLDKDLFRQGLGGLTEAYEEVATRLGIIIEKEESDVVTFRKKNENSEEL